MAQKYRIQLNNQRIIGPFDLDQIAELYIKGHLELNENCQEYPIGDWAPLKNYKPITDLFLKIDSGEISLDDMDDSSDKTMVRIDLARKAKESLEKEEIIDKFKKEGDQSQKFNEFKFDRSDKPTHLPDYLELEEKYKKNQEEKVKAEEELEKTRVLKKTDLKTIEQTIVIPGRNPPPSDEKKEEDLENKETDKEEENKSSKLVIDTDKQTEFIKIDSFLADIKGEVKKTEIEIENFEKNQLEEEKKKEELELIKAQEEKKKNKEEEPVEKKTQKKKLKPVVALAFIALMYMFLFPDKNSDKDIEPRLAIIEFPIVQEYEDAQKSKTLLDEGIKEYSKGKYTDKIIAADNFKKSLSYKFRDNEALGHLILTYSELFPNTSNKTIASNTIFKLIEISQGKVVTDINIALGAAIFYSHFDKYQTAVNTVENYLRLGKPSLKLFSYYLNFLIKTGDIVKARRVFEKMKASSQKNIEASLAMANFLEVDQNFDEAKSFIHEAGKMDPTSVPLLLEYAEIVLREKNLKELVLILKNVRDLKAELCPVYFSKYLEYLGILSAAQNDNVKAEELFRKALAINESEELRSKLAMLDVGGSKGVESLILESKAIQLISKSKVELELGNFEKSYIFALNSTEVAPEYIPAQLALANVQIVRGHYLSALETLEMMVKKYPLDKKVNYSLVNAYLQTYKFEEARNHLQILAGNKDFKETSNYATLMARYYKKTSNFILAVKWFSDAINKNPVSDEDYFLLGSLFYEYKRFKKAKPMVAKAIALDPQNSLYRKLQASILYEYESVDTALGYLRDFMGERNDDPIILGEIAKYYYRAGRIKEFEEYKEKIEKMNKKDVAFYQFLVETSALEDRPEEVLEYTKTIIKIAPGNLEARMSLGEYYFGRENYPNATTVFDEVKSKLPSMPKVNYFLSKMALVKGEKEKALELAQEEMKHNPQLEGGYVAAGEAFQALAEYAKAEHHFEKAIAVAPKAPGPLAALADLKHRQGHNEAARELLLRAIAQDPNDPDFRYKLGKVYKTIGQGMLAIEQFEVYLKLSPQGKQQAEVKQLIRSIR